MTEKSFLFFAINSQIEEIFNNNHMKISNNNRCISASFYSNVFLMTKIIKEILLSSMERERFQDCHVLVGNEATLE